MTYDEVLTCFWIIITVLVIGLIAALAGAVRIAVASMCVAFLVLSIAMMRLFG
jgi:hypothetical protein